MIVGKTGRLPYPVDVTCNHGKINDLIPVFNFIVILNEFVFGFSEVSGIDKDIPFDEIREGGNPYPVFARKRSHNSFEQLNFRKGLLIRKGNWSSDAMRAAASQAALIPGNIARKAALILAASNDPIASLENGPAYGFLQVFDRQYKEPLVSFSFFSHGASRWDITDLNASSGEFMYETITLVCSDLKRLANSALPSGWWDSKNQEEHEYYENIYEKAAEEIAEEMKKNNNAKQSEEQSETDKSIDSKKQEEDISQLNRKERLKKFIEYQNKIKLERQKEREELEKENAEVKDKQQKNKKKFEDKEKESVDKLIEEIKKMDPEFTGKSTDGKDISKADLLKKLQELNNAKIKEEQQKNKKKFDDKVQESINKLTEENKEKFKNKEKESVDKLIAEIKQIDPNFSGEGMSKADLLKKLQELTKAKRQQERKEFEEKNAKIKDDQQKNKKKFEDKEQESINKLIEEIKKIDSNFNGEGMSKADLLKKLQELNNAKVKKGHQENKKKFEDKEKESVDKLIEEIKKIDPNFSGEGMSKADILKKLQEANNAKVDKEHQENKEKFEKKKQQNSKQKSSEDK